MSRTYSPAPSQGGMMYPPPGYQSGRNTPMSMSGLNPNVLHQPMPSRPPTNYLDVAIPTSHSPEDLDLPAGAPTDAEIGGAVEVILRDADLTTVTKREIRRKLEDHFGVDLSTRKQAINSAIDRILLARAG